jgi:hypothetical protein
MNRQFFITLALILITNSVQLKAQKHHRFLFFEKKAKTEKVVKKESTYENLFKKPHKVAKGFITLHMLNGKVYFEFPVKLFNKEMLIGSTITKISDNGNAIVGSKPTSPFLVTFTRNKTNVQLRSVNTDFILGNTPSDKVLEDNNMNAILYNERIITYNADSTAVVFDMTNFFVGDNKKMTPFDNNSLYGRYERTQDFKSDCSYIDDVKSFDDNASVKSTLTYTFSLSSSGETIIKNKPFTAEMTRSILLLKDKPYRYRLADYRIGVFSTERERLGSDVKTTAPVYFANRWDIEPSDTAAFLRGEKVKPKKQIVFYIDNAFPQNWKTYIKEGVTQWNELFEKIGFKNAIVAKDFPTDDPQFDPDNIKYSCIRYAPINIQNAMGPSWVDPRSGEILMASVYVYHDVVKLINNWRFVQTAQTDADVRTVNVPEKIWGDALRYVISHEVGHCLGFMHNMCGSYAIPVDSLRSPSFTQKYGTTMSIMDYARFNYVAQPGDKVRGVKLTPPRFGKYDGYIVHWTYAPVFGVKTPKDEAVVTSKWITDALKDSCYRYGKQQMSGIVDPRSQTEDLGNDAIKATKYGIKNLKYIMKNIDKWITKDDDDYEYRSGLVDGIVQQLAMYITHVAANVGGCYMNEVKVGDPMPRFAPLNKEYQEIALKYLFQIYNDLDWLDYKPLLSKFTISGSPKTTVQNFMMRYIFSLPISVSVFEGMNKNSFKSADAFNMIFNFVWEPSLKSSYLSDSQMSLQKHYIYSMMANAGFEIKDASNSLTNDNILGMNENKFDLKCYSNENSEEIHNPVSGFESAPLNRFATPKVTQADIYAYVLKARNLMKKHLASAKGKTKAHYELLLKTIQINLK